MQHHSPPPLKLSLQPNDANVQLLASHLRRVTTLAQGNRLHDRIKSHGLDQDTYLASLLISMYFKFGDLRNARYVFDNLKYPSVVSWNCIITAYSKNELPQQALHLFREMLQKGHKPNRITFLVVLGACTSTESLAEGKWIHAYVIKEGFKRDVAVCNALITMYSRCGDLKESASVFYSMQTRNLISWNSVIAACAKHGEEGKALELFSKMQKQGIRPDRCTFLGLLGVFVSPESLAQVSWTTMLHVYASNEWADEALQLFQKLQHSGIEPELPHYISAFDACGMLCALEEGKMLHSSVSSKTFATDVRIGNALISMYSKCRALGDACRAFDNMPDHDVVSWNAIISAYGKEGNVEQAFSHYLLMQDRGLQPNRLTFIGVLSACISSDSLVKGKTIHTRIIDCGFDMDDFIGNALIHMYGNCHAKEEALHVFYQMSSPDLASWNAMLTAYCCCGDGRGALRLFQKLKKSVKPDKATFLSIFKACKILRSPEMGKVFHASLSDYGLESDAAIAGAI